MLSWTLLGLLCGIAAMALSDGAILWIRQRKQELATLALLGVIAWLIWLGPDGRRRLLGEPCATPPDNWVGCPD